MSFDIRVVANFVVFQLAWFACVISAARGHALLGTAAVALAVALHAWLSRRARPELIMVALAIGIGGVWDSFVAATGMVRYSSGLFAAPLAPYWILAMWALFATTLNATFVWMRGRYAVAAVFGAIGGPLSYYAGVRLGAVEAVDLKGALALQAIGWAVLMPLLIRTAPSFDGFQRGVPARGVSPLREVAQNV